MPVNYVMVGDTPDKDVKDSLMAILDKEPNLRVFFGVIHFLCRKDYISVQMCL